MRHIASHARTRGPKPGRCFCCEAAISPGDPYIDQRWVDDDPYRLTIGVECGCATLIEYYCRGSDTYQAGGAPEMADWLGVEQGNAEHVRRSRLAWLDLRRAALWHRVNLRQAKGRTAAEEALKWATGPADAPLPTSVRRLTAEALGAALDAVRP